MRSESGIKRRCAKVTDPGGPVDQRLFSEDPGALFERLVTFVESTRQVWVSDPEGSWDKAGDQVAAFLSAAGARVNPALDTLVKHSGRVVGVGERLGLDEPR
jgi:hypothetical protein